MYKMSQFDTTNTIINFDKLIGNGSGVSGMPTLSTLSSVLSAGNTATNSIILNNTGTGANVISLLPNASASNPTIKLTDGTTTNTIDKNGYTTINSVQNTTHYLTFSDASTTGTGSIKKTSGISCNPFTNTVSSTNFIGSSLTSSGNIIVDSQSLLFLGGRGTTIEGLNGFDINLNSFNLNANNLALPICLNQFEIGTWSYTIGSQVFQDVFSANPIIINLPNEFFGDSPSAGYTSTNWQINFDMNCWNFVNAGDKGFAIYLSFINNNGDLIESFLYNQLTPYCKWDNPPTFNGANGRFKSINFCDFIDFAALVGSNDSKIRLQMNIAGDNQFLDVEYKFKLGFTRIQRI